MKYLIPDKVYKVLKWGGLVILPACATAFGTIASAWGMDAGLVSSITTTICAVSTFIGAVLGISAATAKEEQ